MSEQSEREWKSYLLSKGVFANALRFAGRFITPAFKFQSNRLPPAIRALIRAHSVSKPTSKSKI